MINKHILSIIVATTLFVSAFANQTETTSAKSVKVSNNFLKYLYTENKESPYKPEVKNIVSKQDNNEKDSTKNVYTRGNGFIVRPELYSGLFATIGYQINPYVQLSGGIGFGLDEYGGLVTNLGARAYTSPTSWAAFIDYHIGFISIQGINLTRHTIVGGVSYKDFDLGGGIMYLTYGFNNAIGLSITIGYNIRCYKHR